MHMANGLQNEIPPPPQVYNTNKDGIKMHVSKYCAHKYVTAAVGSTAHIFKRRTSHVGN